LDLNHSFEQMETTEDIEIKIVSNETEMEECLKIRQSVFVEEQEVSAEEEYDEFEKESIHYLLLKEHNPVATARSRKTPNGYKIERCAVLKDQRGKGVGAQLVQFVIEQSKREKSPNDCIYLNAQIHAQTFYEKLGFVAEEPIFFEANIPHRKMILSNT